jgi:hypothetical protein
VPAAEAGQAVPWTKPADLEFDSSKLIPKLGGMYEGVFNMLGADGAVHRVPVKVKPDVFRRLILRDDDEVVSWDEAKK